MTYVFLEVDVRVLLRLAGLLVRLEVFRAEDVLPRVPVLFPRVPVLFEEDRARPLAFFEPVLLPDRLVLEPDRAVDFRRRVTATTPAVPAAPAAAPRRGPAAPLATRAVLLTTFFTLLCFFLNIPLPPQSEYASIYPRGRSV